MKLLGKKNKTLIIPGYQAQVENSIFIEKEPEGKQQKVLTITRYALPTGDEVITCLQQKASVIDKLRRATHAVGLQTSPLELLLQSNVQLSAELAYMSGATQKELREHFPDCVDHVSDGYTRRHFAAVTSSMIPKKKVEEIGVMEGSKNPEYWNSKSETRWTMDIFYDYERPSSSQIKSALEAGTINSRIVKTTNVDEFHQEMQPVAKSICKYIDNNTKFFKWQDLSEKKIENTACQTACNLFYNRFQKRQLEQQKELVMMILKLDREEN